MTLKIATNLFPSLLAGWKFLLSFRKRDWSLKDYPVIIRKQRDPGQESARLGRLTLPAYCAQIVNWTLTGTGETAAAALEQLKNRFNKARETRPSMPRPGRQVPLEFASQKRIEANSALANEFLQSVFEVEDAWISDESTLWDFALEDPLDESYAKIQSLYGVDVSDIPDGNLADVLERIAQSRQKRVEAPRIP
jgi:hypothetical protein